MKLHRMLKNKKFSLVVSLPANDLELAAAAVKGGAQAVKVHMNVLHAASKNSFGSFEDNRSFLEKLISLAGEIPVGAVPGGADRFITPDEMRQLETMGLDFFSSYAEHLPPFMMESYALSKMVALHDTYAQILDAVAKSEIDVVEASIMPVSEYGKPLRYFDLLAYADIAAKTNKPVLVPTQKSILPEEVRHLYEAGCKAVMIGVNVMENISPEACLKAASAFREAVDAL